MNDITPIVCKPTSWFIFRGVVIFGLFGFFAIWFFRDGAVGYRKENEQFFLYQTFDKAVRDFERMSIEARTKGQSLSKADWEQYASKQEVSFPCGQSLLPEGIVLPMKWPKILSDYSKVEPKNVRMLWQEYAGGRQFAAVPPEHGHDASKIAEQWIAGSVCAILSLSAGLILLRTLRRTIEVDQNGLKGANGKRLAFKDLKRLDLRKWETKGLAYIDYDGEIGQGRLRIDGLTYGGFKLDQGQPAEKLMEVVKSHFEGEIIDYYAADERNQGGEE